MFHRLYYKVQMSNIGAMMTTAILTFEDQALLDECVKILDALGPFEEDAKRSAKWRTADQLADALSTALSAPVMPGQVTRVLGKVH